MKARARICPILLLLTIAGYAAVQAQPNGCGTTDVIALGNLRSARSLWQSSDVESYVMQVFKTCFCSFEATGPFLVMVDDGVLTDVQFAPGGPTGTPSPDIANSIPTVEGLFDIVEEALLEKAELVNVNYNETTGVLVYIFIECSSLSQTKRLGTLSSF